MLLRLHHSKVPGLKSQRLNDFVGFKSMDDECWWNYIDNEIRVRIPVAFSKGESKLIW
jgi:hypothetical protein